MYFQCLRINPNVDKCLGNLGDCFYNTGKFEQSIFFYKRCLLVNPDDACVRKRLETEKEVSRFTFEVWDQISNFQNFPRNCQEISKIFLTFRTKSNIWPTKLIKELVKSTMLWQNGHEKQNGLIWFIYSSNNQESTFFGMQISFDWREAER